MSNRVKLPRLGKTCLSCVKRLNEQYNNFSLAKRTLEESLAINANVHVQVHSNVLDACVDEEMLPLLEKMYSLGFKTWISCQGHSRYPMFVHLSGKVEEVYEMMEDKLPGWNAYLTYKKDYYNEDYVKNTVFGMFNTELQFSEKPSFFVNL